MFVERSSQNSELRDCGFCLFQLKPRPQTRRHPWRFQGHELGPTPVQYLLGKDTREGLARRGSKELAVGGWGLPRDRPLGHKQSPHRHTLTQCGQSPWRQPHTTTVPPGRTLRPSTPPKPQAQMGAPVAAPCSPGHSEPGSSHLDDTMRTGLCSPADPGDRGTGPCDASALTHHSALGPSQGPGQVRPPPFPG